MKQVMIVAAEASSSLFALRLLEQWKKEKNDIKAFGVGSQAMENIGFERLGKSEEMAVVGAAEIIEHYGKLKIVFNNLVQEAALRKPQVVVLMDYPEFNLMLAKKLHKLGIPVVYYISPQIWAWRKGRVETIKKYCEKVLLLFPFEASFYQEKNVPYEFVGHPLLDELDEKYFDKNFRLSQRRRCGVQDDEILLGLMPGSRRLEIKQHLQIQLATARLLYNNYKKIRVLIMCAPSVDIESLREQIGDAHVPYMLQKEDPESMINMCDLILAASGTATLQVGLLEKPMVIMYKMKWLTGIIAHIFVRGVKYFGLVNLIAGRELVPERFQSRANPQELYTLLKRYIDDPVYKNEVISELKKIQSTLGERGATIRVARVLDKYFQNENLPKETL